MTKELKQADSTKGHGVAELKARLNRTRRNGRFQQALELAKQLHDHAPTEEHLELLKETYLQRAEQLAAMGKHRDGVLVVEAAAQLDRNNLQWLSRLIDQMSLLGDPGKTMQLLDQWQALGGALQPAHLQILADASLVMKPSGRDHLPSSLQVEFDRIVLAFEQVETGQDEAARETLQGINLNSPFLEWKLLLRGLQAYYQQDDPRAILNWQRLDPRRVPARLAAPFRNSIDPDYRAAQPTQAQQQLQHQLGWLQCDELTTHLRALRQALTNRQTLAPAFRAVESMLPLIRQRAPHLVDRLARCLYWAILRYGPSELSSYVRIFDLPADDPNFRRLEAIALERAGEWAGAHRSWQAYEKEIAANPDQWPGEQGMMTRAYIWQRMGDNAARYSASVLSGPSSHFLQDMDSPPKPLQPSSKKCFARSLALVPSLREAHEGLVNHCRDEMNARDGIRAAERLLQHYPDHVETWKTLFIFHLSKQNLSDARRALENACRHNPLDRSLREQLGGVHQMEARESARQGKFDDARQHYQAAVEFCDPVNHPGIWCRWACCEIKAGDQARADELLDQARAKMPGELYLTYLLLIETIRMSLASTLKAKLTRTFNADIEAEPTPELAVRLVELAADYAEGNIEYHGRQTHARKIIAYASRVPFSDLSESQLERLFRGFLSLKAATRFLNQRIECARRAYPDNPQLPYLQAILLTGYDPEKSEPHWSVTSLLDEAERLAMQRPVKDAALNAMLEDIKQRRYRIIASNPLFGRLSEFFGTMGSFDDED